MDMIKTGGFLAQLRKEKGLTQEQLGDNLGVSNKTISRWENGNYMPPVEMLQAMSELYGISINEILSGQRLAEEEYREQAEANIKSALDSSFSLKERITFYKKKWNREHRMSLCIALGLYVLLVVLGMDQDSRGLHLIAWFLLSAFIIVRYNMMMAYVERRAFDPPLEQDALDKGNFSALIMKRLRITALMALALCLWITIDLTINYFASLVPEINDGVTVRGIWSMLFFGVDGYHWNILSYYKGFAAALKITAFVGIINIVLACMGIEQIKEKERG